MTLRLLFAFYYVITAISVFIYMHEDVEEQKFLKGDDCIEESDVFMPLVCAVIWPSLPFFVILSKFCDYICYDVLKRDIKRMNEKNTKSL